MKYKNYLHIHVGKPLTVHAYLSVYLPNPNSGF